MSNLTVIEVQGQNVVDSRLIADELGIEHKSFIRTIRKYETELSAFGVLGFENAKPPEGSNGGRPETFCYLNEDQATFVMTLSKNTERVVQCKKNLVIAFKVARAAIAGQPTLPQTYLEALKALVAAEEQKALLEAEKQLLEEANHGLSEALDELFDYSSIIRIAKYNGVSEKSFTWHRLKAVSMKLGIEIKKAPCPRFGEKNLYSHDVWRVAYPEAKLPETTTLVIHNDGTLG